MIVQKSVSGIAQEMIRKLGITLILDVKPSIISRIQKCLQCDIVTSVDSNIGYPTLGKCSQFEIKKFMDPSTQRPKHIIVLRTDGNPKNCCVLLRGGTLDELTKLKRITRQILYSRYNWRFQIALLIDEGAFNRKGRTGRTCLLPDNAVCENSPKRGSSIPRARPSDRSRTESNVSWRSDANCAHHFGDLKFVFFQEIPVFLTTAVSTPVDSRDFQAALSQFRAGHGVLKKKPKCMSRCLL